MGFYIKNILILLIIGFIVLICGCTGAQVVQPTPEVIYVTVTPSPTPQIIYVTVTPQPTTQVIYVTQPPAAPTAAPTPTPISLYRISGVIHDRNGGGVPSATVKLWDGSILYSSPENPQLTVSNPSVALVGAYSFYRIPPGTYRITAEKMDAAGTPHTASQSVTITSGDVTMDITISDLVVNPPPTSTPKPLVQHTVGLQVSRTSPSTIAIKTLSGDTSTLNAIYVYVNNQYYIYTPSSSSGSPSVIGSVTTFDVPQNTPIQVVGDFTDGYSILYASTI